MSRTALGRTLSGPCLLAMMAGVPAIWVTLIGGWLLTTGFGDGVDCARPKAMHGVVGHDGAQKRAGSCN